MVGLPPAGAEDDDDYTSPQSASPHVSIQLEAPKREVTTDAGFDSVQSMQHLDEEGVAPLLVGKQALVREARKVQTRKRRNICVAACMGSTLLFLVLMAVLFTGRHSKQSDSQDAGGYVTPTMATDYRGKPRRVESSRGIVAADQSQCSDIGAQIIQEGGNAMDATIATCLCQGVLNPYASGIGGGFFMSVRAPNGTADFIDAREVAPQAATRDMYNGGFMQAFKSEYGMPASASTNGGLAVAVPMELKGLQVAHDRWGRLPWARLFEPAIQLARHGFPAYPFYIYTVSGPDNSRMLPLDPLTAEAFLVKDEATGVYRTPKVGEWCCSRPALADTLQAVAREGASWLYSPERAEVLASEIRAAGGIMTAGDILDAQPAVGPLLAIEVDGFEVLMPPPPSSSGVLAMAASIVAGFPTPPYSSPANDWLGQGAAQPSQLLYQHELVEAMKQGFAMRLALGDPGPDPSSQQAQNVSRVMAAITNPQFVSLLRSDIRTDGILNVSQYGREFNPYSGGPGTQPDDHGTTHMSVVDEDRMAVSITSTVNNGFGAFLISPSTGILFNNEMDDFSRPDIPNAYGLAPAEANYIRPGRRPLSSMSPVIVTEGKGPDAQLRLVAGASGGPRILSAVLQTLVRILFQGWDPQDAVAVPRVHHQLLPYHVLYEDYWMPEVGNLSLVASPQLRDYLASKGNKLVPMHDYMGASQVVYVQPDSNILVGVSDWRKDGAPAAVAVQG